MACSGKGLYKRLVAGMIVIAVMQACSVKRKIERSKYNKGIYRYDRSRKKVKPWKWDGPEAGYFRYQNKRSVEG